MLSYQIPSFLELTARCRSWNMRNSTSQALALQQQCGMLALQQLQLNDLQQSISRGNILASQPTGVPVDSRDTPGAQGPRKHHAGHRKLRLRLPQWLISQTWTFAVSQSHGSWALELRPRSWRPFETLALDCLRTGDMTMMKKSLATGDLSIWDSIQHPLFGRPTSILQACTSGIDPVKTTY